MLFASGGKSLGGITWPAHGQAAFVSHLGGPWLDLPSLARLFDLLAWGTLTSDGKLLVAAPEIP